MNGLIVSVVINIFSSIIYDVVGKGIKKLKQIKENAKQSVSRELARMQEQSQIYLIGNYKYIYATVFGQYLWTNLNGILYL